MQGECRRKETHMDALSHELEPSGPHQATLQRQDNTPPLAR